MAQANSSSVFRKRTPIDPTNDYQVKDVRLDFFLPDPNQLSDDNPVHLTAAYKLNLGVDSIDNLELDISPQDEQKINDIYVDGALCEPDEDYHLEIDDTGRRYILFTKTIREGSEFVFDIRLRPDENSAAEGLYISEDRQTGAKIYGTQNEEQGFRRIVPFPDRPSVPISSIETSITAPSHILPVLLSNGDLVDVDKFLDRGKEYKAVKWRIDRPMPGYLFALLAGALDSVRDVHINRDGSTVELSAFTDPGSSDRALVALNALKKAMTFDEDVYGFTFPFKQMKMAGIASFNFQGMENNTLVIFNIMAILSDPRLSSDHKIRHVIRVVAHEYFHTFTGNEVTIKDFTEPALKEGLTTYREIQFTRKIFGAGEDVRRILILRDGQFLDDRSGIAHAVFPGNGIEPRLLYDDTTYRKGAFLYGVLHTLIGDKFYEGMRLYRERFAGRAGNFADFQKVMSDASGMDLSNFFKWFKQPGTPVVQSKWFYDKTLRVWTLSVEQENPLGGPVLMPLPIHFLDDKGQPLAVGLVGEDGSASKPYSSHTLNLSRAKQAFKFVGANPNHPPLAAFGTHLLPIVFKPPYNDAQATQLIESKSLGPMLRYEAAQHILRKLSIEAYHHETLISDDTLDCLIRAYKLALKDSTLDADMQAYLLRLPSVEELSLLIGGNVDHQRLEVAHSNIERLLGIHLEKELSAVLEKSKPLETDAAKSMEGWVAESKKRALRITALKLLNASEEHRFCLGHMLDGPEEHRSHLGLIIGMAQDPKGNITERLAALKIIGDMDLPAGGQIFGEIGKELQSYNYLPLTHEFQSMLATLKNENVFETVKIAAEKALGQKTFVANEVFSSLDTFIVENPVALHAKAPETYPWIEQFVSRLALRNANVTTRIMRHFTRDIALLPPMQQGLMREVLQNLRDSDIKLSAATSQVIERSLKLIAPRLARPDTEGHPVAP